MTEDAEFFLYNGLGPEWLDANLCDECHTKYERHIKVGGPWDGSFSDTLCKRCRKRIGESA
jgi:hypothetical protein